MRKGPKKGGPLAGVPYPERETQLANYEAPKTDIKTGEEPYQRAVLRRIIDPYAPLLKTLSVSRR